ncbi:MAG: hypothetical protein K6B14_04610 [Lachnospiraceae bacterium]|nr:hypothetical protein [Lachnospiraceae bacterium]
MQEQEQQYPALENETEAERQARIYLQPFSTTGFTAKMFSTAYIKRIWRFAWS